MIDEENRRVIDIVHVDFLSMKYLFDTIRNGLRRYFYQDESIRIVCHELEDFLY